MKKIVSVVVSMLLILTVFCSSAFAANYITITNPSSGEPVDAGSNLNVKVKIVGETPSFKQYALRDLSTDEKLVHNREFSGKSVKIPKSMLKPGHDYRVWVASFDASGNKLAQDIVEFKAVNLETVYTCPFRHDYQTTSFVKMYGHCLKNKCFYDNPALRASWEAGWWCLDQGIDNPLFSAICDLLT